MSTQREFTGSGSATFRDLCAGGGWGIRKNSGGKKEERTGNVKAAQQNVSWTSEFPSSHKKLCGPIRVVSHNVFVKKASVQDIFLEDEI